MALTTNNLRSSQGINSRCSKWYCGWIWSEHLGVLHALLDRFFDKQKLVFYAREELILSLASFVQEILHRLAHILKKRRIFGNVQFEWVSFAAQEVKFPIYLFGRELEW